MLIAPAHRTEMMTCKQCALATSVTTHNGSLLHHNRWIA